MRNATDRSTQRFTQRSTQKEGVVIVGAGPGGLAAAILLAGAGLRVTVLERQPSVGGRTSTLEADGFRFDLGPTFFLYPRVLEEIFESVGYDLHREVSLVRLDPQYQLIFGGGGELLATPNLGEMDRQVTALSPQDRGAVQAFLSDNREKFERFRPCIETPFLGWSDVLKPHVMKLLPSIRPWRSLDDELGAYFNDPRVRLAFSFQSKYLGMSPFQCPSLFSILSFLEYEYGVYHPIGGCGALTQAMARVAQELGVDVRTGEPVREILFEGRKAVAARTDAGTYRSDALVINADFARAMTRLVPDRLRRRWTDERIASKKFSCSTFMLYLGIDGRYDHVPHHTIYIAKDYVQNLDDIERLHVLSEDPSFYVQNACVTDPTLAPRGQSTLYVLVPVTHQHPNVDWTPERAPATATWPWSASPAWASRTSSAVSASRRSSPRPTGTSRSRSTREPPSTSPTTSARCSTSARTTASRIWTASTSWAAAPIPAAACPSSSSPP